MMVVCCRANGSKAMSAQAHGPTLLAAAPRYNNETNNNTRDVQLRILLFRIKQVSNQSGLLQQ